MVLGEPSSMFVSYPSNEEASSGMLGLRDIICGWLVPLCCLCAIRVVHDTNTMRLITLELALPPATLNFDNAGLELNRGAPVISEFTSKDVCPVALSVTMHPVAVVASSPTGQTVNGDGMVT